MRKQLTELRKKMRDANIDVYIVPTTDFHGSEYVNAYFKCREYISGFTGSAGTLVVSRKSAYLWTDGRYFIQADEQLKNSGIALMKSGEPGVPSIDEYMEKLHLEFSRNKRRMAVGFDGRVMSKHACRQIERICDVIYDIDLVGEIWKERPSIVPSEIYPIDIRVAGESSESKLARIRQEMGDADFILISSLEEIAWLYNLRGRDIAHTPVFYAFALISKEDDCLYAMDEAFVAAHGGKARYYDEIHNDLKKLRDCTLMMDENTVSYAIAAIPDESVKKIIRKSPVEQMKAVKNQTEIEATRRAHIRDGAAMVEFLYWIKSHIGESEISEISAAAYLENCRRAQGAYDLSFETIAGYEAHGAIVHYAATAESDVKLQPEGLFLVDSGGQYQDGTTDITRTIALGEISKDRKKAYTAVLKGHIALADAKFASGTDGAALDQTAREPLREYGFDFNHGTGHGVGHMLSVHEGPNAISPRAKESYILPGMITSDEPGVYITSDYGIRIENELLCVQRGEGHCGFEIITFCPFERAAIDVDMLTPGEIRFIDEYHREVREKISPLLTKTEAEWLKNECRSLLS